MTIVDIFCVSNLTYEYPGTRALDNVSFSLAKGSVTALVGPNGAGKTTLLRCMAALDVPLEGQIEIEGINVLENPRECHRRIGYLSDFFGLYDALTVRQSLIYAGLSQGLDNAAAQAAATNTAKRLHLEQKLDSRCSELSRGQRQRAAIGQALIHKPALLILDEPASGLDPEARHDLALVFKQLRADGMTLIVSSHILAELDEYSTHMLVIRDGKIIENRSLEQNAPSSDRIHVQVIFTAPPAMLSDAISHAIASLENTELLRCDHERAVIALAADNLSKSNLLRALINAGLNVISMNDDKENLHESYLRSLKSNNQNQRA
ncbi:MAG: ABC transporter ATP-binding protein [Steroidobacteraceae bacterium]